MKYLKDIRTLEELKRNYYDFAKRLHSDAGGTDQEMKILNAEYAEWFSIVKDRHTNRDGNEYTREATEDPEDFQNLLKELLQLIQIRIEVIGSFVWVFGETKQHKQKLKSLGFKWHAKKQCWYLPPAGYRRHGGGEYDMETIRNMYGVSYSEEVRLKELQTVN